MKFRVLGPLEVRDGDRVIELGAGKQLSLLGVLLLHANEAISVARLVDELWGGRPPARSVKLVQGYVSMLRKRLGADRLLTRPPGYLIRVEEGELDSSEFERLVAEARAEPPERAGTRLRQALALWRGPALADVRFEDVAASEAERLNELRLAALLDRIEADLALGGHADLVGELEALVAAHPLSERLRGQLMRALYGSGRQAEALAAYRDARRTLIDELGINPSRELQALERAILNQDPVIGVAPREPDTVELPGPIRLRPSFPFVGRSDELSTLRTFMPRGEGQGRRIVLVGGEAGSGKSRLVHEFAHEAAAQGMLVLYGACDTVARTPYRPFVDVLEHLVRSTDPATLRTDLGPAGGELTRLLPDLALRVGDLPDPVSADPDTERHRLHTAVTDLLRNTARRRPLLLVLEDGHWADIPSLLLLRHVARAGTDIRVLLVATFRDTEADVPTELADTLAELRRADEVVRIRLGGLSEGEIAEFVRSTAADETNVAAPGLPRAIHDLTEGNPFLLCELWRTLAETEELEIIEGTVRLKRPLDEIATPQSVREMVRQRVSRLPAGTRDLLELAAVVGPEFDLEILRRASPIRVQAPTGTVTLLFTDIEGSTTLVRRLGDGYPELLAEHHRLLFSAFGGRGGHEVDRQGDALFFAFRRARDAVQAAVDAQRSVARASFPQDSDVRIRIGIHTGEPGLAATGYHGLGVVKAARISGAAHGGQILVSAATRTLLGDEPLTEIVLEDLGKYRLKDFDEPERIYQIVADGLERRFPPLRADRGEALEWSADSGEIGTDSRTRTESPPTTDDESGAGAAATDTTTEALERSGNLLALEVLEPAERNGMIDEAPARHLAYRFTHELVRRALYDRLSSVRRAELHLRIGKALEAANPSPSGRAVADLAHHFSAAWPLGGSEHAVNYNLLAAEAATAALAFDEAVARLRTALEIGIDGDRRQTHVWLELGAACIRAGESLESIRAYQKAAEIARSIGDGELLARAAVGFEEACWRPGMLDQRARDLLEEASAALPGGDSPLRVSVLAGLARALASQGDHSRGVVVRANAIEMARRIDDRHGLATVLMHSYWARGSTPLEDVLEMLTESRDLAAEMGDIEIHALAMEWRVIPLMVLGDTEAARRELATVTEMAERVRQPFILYVAEQHASAIALLEGRLSEAQAAAERSREWGRLLRGRDAAGTYGIQMFAIRREQGRLAELAPIAQSLAAANGADTAWRPAFAALLAELGMEEELERELAHVRREGLGAFRQSLWVASLIYLTDACSAIGQQEVAALVYPELAPFTGTNVMIGSGVVCCGAADRYLGMLAATLGDTQRAQGHFAAALELNRRMGATTWLAHTCYEYARMLQSSGEHESAESLAAEAAALAEQVGMPTLRGRIRGLSPASAMTRSLPDGLSEREAAVLRLVARGLSNRQIGAELSISAHTAANHVRGILRKTGCANRTEAASYAHRRGFVENAPNP